ncbi:MAG: triosephosphate isomerase [Candidatus Binatia bacterium]|nr:MAG: triosephosphate isomerase [Candidatus Binatia bacterium]
MRVPLIVGNWKMHGLIAEARNLAHAVRQGVARMSGRQVAVAPPFTALGAVAKTLQGSSVLLAAQNMHWEERGAFTGEVSPLMLRDIGCELVILGHSERRQFFGEDDATVRRKVHAALKHNLTPIVCVGETLAEREAGQTLAVVTTQVRAALLDLDPAAMRRVVVAYEPVWAIGTGRVAAPQQAQEVHSWIRQLLFEQFGEVAAEIRILYGGSVKPDNIDALMAEPDIDGALVGGASLDAASFVRIAGFMLSEGTN